MYHPIKTLYAKPQSCVIVGERLSPWFTVKAGVRQGDSLSLILFTIFINDLAQKLNILRTGIDVGDALAILMYANDIILLGSNCDRAQDDLNILSDLCMTWGMKVNIKKSQVVHHRGKRRPRCQKLLVLCGSEMEYVTNYKYFGCWVNEHGEDTKMVEALTAATRCSYGRIINIFKKLGDMGPRTHGTLYEIYVLPIANGAVAVWDFKDHPAPKVLQDRINRFYLGVHRFASVVMTSIEMDLPLIRCVRWGEMLHYHNGLMNMPDTHWLEIVYEYDIKKRCTTWVHEVKQICKMLHLK